VCAKDVAHLELTRFRFRSISINMASLAGLVNYSDDEDSSSSGDEAQGNCLIETIINFSSTKITLVLLVSQTLIVNNLFFFFFFFFLHI
jgi:hypothetical protein